MEGHVINQKLYNKSGCPNLGNFQESDKKTIKLELENLVKRSEIQIKDLENKTSDLLEYFIYRYGKKATELIYKPIYEKFTGLKIEELSTSNKDHFAPSRMIVFNRKKSKNLKKNIFWDFRIAYSDCNDSESSIKKYYPKNGGIYKWIKDIKNNLLNKGVEIYLQTEITNIETSNKQIKYIFLSNGEKIKCNTLYWTVPSFNFLKLTKSENKSIKPILRKQKVIHFLVDKAPVKRPFWINFYDKNFIS